MFFSDDQPLSGLQLATLEQHERLAEWVAETLSELPKHNDPWVELAPIVNIVQAALTEAERMLHSSRTMIEIGEIADARKTGSALCAIARTLRQQVHALGDLLGATGADSFLSYQVISRDFSLTVFAYEETLFGDEIPF